MEPHALVVDGIRVRWEERGTGDAVVPLHGIPGGKHFSPEDHPDVIAEEIEALLESV